MEHMFFGPSFIKQQSAQRDLLVTEGTVLIKILIRGGADKSLARPASWCRRTESIVSLERGVCSCAELQVFSCYRGWKEACQATRAISATSRRELSSSFFSCNPEETGLPGLPLSWSPTLPRIWPCRTTTCSLNWKKTIEMSPFFVWRGGHCCRGDLVGRTTFWIFFSGLEKLEQRAKKYIELRGGLCWINPEFGRCSLFPSWSG